MSGAVSSVALVRVDMFIAILVEGSRRPLAGAVDEGRTCTTGDRVAEARGQLRGNQYLQRPRRPEPAIHARLKLTYASSVRTLPRGR